MSSYQIYLELTSNYNRIKIDDLRARDTKYRMLQINTLVYRSSATPSENLSLIIQNFTGMVDVATQSEVTTMIPLIGTNTTNIFEENQDTMTCVNKVGVPINEFTIRVLQDGVPSLDISSSNRLKLKLTFFE